MCESDLNAEIVEQVYTLYSNVKHLREKNSFTIKQMAEIMDIREEKLMLAETCTDIDCFYDIHIKNICTYFKVSADYLFMEKMW